MTTKRKKVAVLEITHELAVFAFSKYADADARLDKINAQMDIEFTKIRDKYADEVLKLETAKEENFAILHLYATGNPDDFSKKKSMEFTHGKIGFRTGTPALKTLKGFTWDKVVELVKKHRTLKSYLKVSTSVQKDKLLADREQKNFAKYFERCGFKVEQTESFYVEPKKEEVANAA